MSKFAIALDIGTTNISSALVDIGTKRVISNSDVPNEQIVYGDDVISRLKFATTEKGMKELNKKLMNSIDSAINFLVERAKVNKDAVVKIVAVGNAAMYHLTFLLSVNKLAQAPYSASQTGLVKKEAAEVGLKDFAKSEFIFLPNIGGFIGSDAIGVILAMDMHKDEAIKLAIDLGTNGEIILGNSKKILVTSTAAGPAFEGWHISCGLRPVPGAIIHFEMKNSKVILKTIEDFPPKGIASSGLVKIISTLIEEGRIDKTGRIRPDEFTIYKDSDKRIYLNQKDIREIQLAKSAIHTAITLLNASYQLNYEDVERITVTGRFGGSLNKQDLVRIGVIPHSLKEKDFDFIENLALKGASLILLEDRMDELDSILRITKHIELQKEENFQEEFAKGLRFD